MGWISSFPEITETCNTCAFEMTCRDEIFKRVLMDQLKKETAQSAF